VKAIFKEIVSAVGYFHAMKIRHRDLKLENILIKDYTVKICDFGQATDSDKCTKSIGKFEFFPIIISRG
jgi:serine/threonine protein kinase